MTMLASISHASLFNSLIESYEIGDNGIPLDPRDLVPDSSTITDLELALYYLRYRCSLIIPYPKIKEVVQGETELFARLTFPKLVRIENGLPVDPRSGDGPYNLEEVASFMVCEHAYLRALGQNADFTPSAASLIKSVLPDSDPNQSSSECSDSGHERLTKQRSKPEFDERLALSWSYYCDEIKEYKDKRSVDMDHFETIVVGKQPIRLFSDYFYDPSEKKNEKEPADKKAMPPMKSATAQVSINTLSSRKIRAEAKRQSIVASCSWEKDFSHMPSSYSPSVC